MADPENVKLFTLEHLKGDGDLRVMLHSRARGRRAMMRLEYFCPALDDRTSTFGAAFVGYCGLPLTCSVVCSAGQAAGGGHQEGEGAGLLHEARHGPVGSQGGENTGIAPQNNAEENRGRSAERSIQGVSCARRKRASNV